MDIPQNQARSFLKKVGIKASRSNLPLKRNKRGAAMYTILINLQGLIDIGRETRGERCFIVSEYGRV